MKTLLDKGSLIFNPPELGCVLSLSGLPGGDSKIYDRSPYGNVGTITGATWVRTEGGLWCQSYDGSDDFTDCGTGSSLDIYQNITIKLWFKPTALANYLRLVSRGIVPQGGSNRVQYYLGYHSDGRLIFGRFEGLTWVETMSVTSTINTGRYYHVAVTHDGSTLTFYVNGVAEVISDAWTMSSQPGQSLYIGAHLTPSQFANGRIGLVEIHNSVKPSNFFTNSYNREKHLFGVW